MKIAATMVSMDAARSYTEVDQLNTVFQQKNVNPFSFREPTQGSSGNAFRENLFTLINSSSSNRQYGTSFVSSQEESLNGLEDLVLPTENQARDQALSSLAQTISGRPVSVGHVLSESRNGMGSNVEPLSIPSVSFASSSIHMEQEAICFHAGGTVQTECGQTISFSMGLEMERQKVSFQATGFARNNYFIDPLVLNFDENISIFDDTFFTFDLDGDGCCEELSGIGSGCGFLALDRNGDGTISDGLELFGPATGDGFGELAELDGDGNSWIDENDPIFDELFVWMGAGGEDEKLVSLRDAGVGAISVANLGTQFNLEDQDGEVRGVVRASGLFLMENGEPRSMQEIDLTTHAVQPVGEEPANGATVDGNLENFGETYSAETSNDGIQESINDLREIISWQRLKMKMLLARALLKSQDEELIERLKHLSLDFFFSSNSQKDKGEA